MNTRNIYRMLLCCEKLANKARETKRQTATVISLWFCGLLAYPELYCDQARYTINIPEIFRCSRFSEFDSNVLSNFLILSDTFIFNIFRFEGKIDGILMHPINSTI